jgi:hypothetical protein
VRLRGLGLRDVLEPGIVGVEEAEEVSLPPGLPRLALRQPRGAVSPEVVVPHHLPRRAIERVEADHPAPVRDRPLASGGRR